MEPESAGSRERLPGSAPSRVGTGLPERGAVLIDLVRSEESMLVADAFRRLGWQVKEGGLIEAALAGGYDLVVTDALDDLATFLDQLHPEPLAGFAGGCIVFVLSDSDDASVGAAWAAGADHVIGRPFDPEDPMGTRAFAP